jgi:hypothetical protein
MTFQDTAQGDWRSLVEEDFHSGLADRLSQRFLRVLDYSQGLIAFDTREPFQKFGDGCASFNVFEERHNRHTRPFEYPGAAYFAGDSLDGETL